MDEDISVRSAARLILVDQCGDVLLFLYEDRSGRRFWATPGGGVGSGETVEEAARREAAEELGIDGLQLTQLWTGQAEFMLGDRLVSQVETFFLVEQHSPRFKADVVRFHKAEGIEEARWWSVSQIKATDTPVFPADLVARLREHGVGVQ